MNDCSKPSHACDPCEVMHSIALEETALSHILNAEGEKIQAALTKDASIHELLCVNRSVAATIRDVTSLEIVLLNKLEALSDVPPCPVPTPVHKGSLCVMVSNCNSHEGLCGATVCLCQQSQQKQCGSTDRCGTYEFKNLACGTYEVSVRYRNFPICTKTVMIDGNCCKRTAFCFPYSNACYDKCQPNRCVYGYHVNSCGQPKS